MTTTLRSTKGAPLTYAEMDENFQSLEATNPCTIEVNSTSDALRITQTGAGNALVVEDSTNPDSSPFIIDAAGKDINGYTSWKNEWYSAGHTPNSFNVRANVNINGYGSINYGGSAGYWMARSAGASIGDRGILSSGNVIGVINFVGDDGVSAKYISAARISGVVDGTPGTNDMPGRLIFSTTAAGASAPTERMRISATGESWFQANNSTSTVTITQTGTGNALVVEDTTSPDSTPFKIDANGTISTFGRLQIGSDTSITGPLGVTPKIQVHSNITSAGTNHIGMWSSITSYRPTIALTKSASSTIGTHAIVGTGDIFGTISFSGSDGTNFIRGAEISTMLDGTPGTDDMPGRLIFSTTADGASSPTERLRIDSSGNILNNSTGGLGYGTGSGGAVTQETSRTTGVTLDKTNGAITLVSAAGSTSWQTFIVTNNTVAETDVVIVNQKSGTDLNEIHVTAVATGSFNITFRTTGGTTTEQPVFNFAVIKAVTS